PGHQGPEPAQHQHLAAQAIAIVMAAKSGVGFDQELQPNTTFGRFFAGTGFPNHFFCDSWVVGFLEWPTMVRRTSDWRDELGRWLKPFLDRLGHKARRQMCPLYVSGLIGPGDRKSVQPMAKRLALGACDQLHHFIAAGVWDATPVETELLVQADRLVGG